MASDSKTWAGRIAAWQASGLSARAFAEGKGYTAGALYFWRNKLGQVGEGPRLARVVRIREAPPATAIEPTAPRTATAIAVEIAGARVIVPPNFDRSSLDAILALLAERAEASR